jgi:predicted membrane-bound spermidine synthase
VRVFAGLLVVAGLAVWVAWPTTTEGDRLVMKSASGYQTVSMLDGGRTGLYYDFGELIGELRPNARRVVLLGMGGGEMLRAARRTLPRAQLIGVELNPLVAAAAIKDFGMRRLGVRVVVADAASYVKDIPVVSTDALLVDVYDDYKLPEYFRSVAFFRDCRHALVPRGLLLMNVWPPTLGPEVADAMAQAGFSGTTLLSAGDNVMVLAER